LLGWAVPHLGKVGDEPACVELHRQPKRLHLHCGGDVLDHLDETILKALRELRDAGGGDVPLH
jgi:hypothetical protein